VRKAMNENPVVQVVIVGALAVVVGFLFLTRIMGGNEAEPAPADPAAAAAAPSTTPAAADAAAEPVPTDATAESASAAGAAPVVAGTAGFEAGPGLPEPVVDAYERGDVIVLLVSKEDGIEDKRLREDMAVLESRPDTAVFMSDTREVAKYSRIAQGVDLDRAPALVVVRPKRFADGGLPEASVTYGFRKPDSVAQAVRDAQYKGQELPYHPG
jgi:hypothetical protein